MCGTETGDAGACVWASTRPYRTFFAARYCPTVSAYALATACPVLNLSGTDEAYATCRTGLCSSVLAMRCPAMLLPAPQPLDHRLLRRGGAVRYLPTLPAYALATRCPILTDWAPVLLLPGHVPHSARAGA
eukprot:1009768-Rhodomonas_salina.2